MSSSRGESQARIPPLPFTQCRPRDLASGRGRGRLRTTRSWVRDGSAAVALRGAREVASMPSTKRRTCAARKRPRTSRLPRLWMLRLAHVGASARPAAISGTDRRAAAVDARRRRPASGRSPTLGVGARRRRRGAARPGGSRPPRRRIPRSRRRGAGRAPRATGRRPRARRRAARASARSGVVGSVLVLIGVAPRRGGRRNRRAPCRGRCPRRCDRRARLAPRSARWCWSAAGSPTSRP